MKKTLLFVCFAACLLVLVTGCLEPDDSGDLFSPPSWIRGTWGDSTQYHVYVFTTHDIALASPYFASSNFSLMYEDKDVAETVTDSLYEITVSEDSSLIMNYRFEKVTSSTLNYTGSTGSSSVGPIELVKE